MSTPRHIGTLIVVILKARNLPNKRHIGKQDPYCQVIFNGEKRRTKAIKRGGQHPEWDEEIRFELYEDTEDIPHIPELNGDGPPPPPPPKSTAKGPPKVKGGKYMALACYAEDPREPDLIGETKVDLTEVLTKGETDEWFTVMNKDKYCGEVYLELTFWLDEPPPTKKVKAKPNGQYGGRGTFVPIGESASSSLTELDHYSVSSRLSASSTREDIRRENLPPSLRSSSSRLDIYVAPYESTRSHNSSVDGIVNEFAELRVEQGGNRRQSMPAQTGSYLPRPASSLGLPEPTSYADSASAHRQSTYSDGGGYQYDYNSGPPQAYHQDSAPLPDPYQPAYEQAPPPSGFQPQHQGRPRYSLPPTSSGFVPLANPAPSGFMPISPILPQPSGFHPPPSATPAPYGAPVPARVPSSSFSTLPPASSGFAPPTPPTSSYSQPITPSSSQYYPPPQNPPPPTSYSQHGQHSPSTYPQQGSPLPPSSSFPQNAQPPPTSSYPQNIPTSSFPHNPQGHSAYSQPPALPPPSAPPQPQQSHYAYGPSGSPSIPQHSHSAPPEQPQYTGHHTSSPSHGNIPPPPPLTDSPSRGHTTGSRPLPIPQAQSQQPQQFAHHPRRQSSLPVPPPPSSQGYQNGTQNPPSFPSAMPYQSVPPPPPLPQQPPQPQSSFPQNGQPLMNPGPPPPLPSSQYQPAQAPAKRRPSLPAPPVSRHSQQLAFQSLPPPPPPPSLPSHLQYEPTSSFIPGTQGQAYYPGPPPRPPQYLPPNGPPQSQGGYSPPVAQGHEYGR
ncbi:hypothetical protein ONZ51_g604 [Trametes cubensis]|uniref:C2 domain-containing protein n=1 Tax=Trametes cubensis TaxID=1111947 RepID=A0AAD7U4F9_9APHY|nr:hypothetical protein ONZ51_g604 [Trametes cubensis]